MIAQAPNDPATQSSHHWWIGQKFGIQVDILTLVVTTKRLMKIHQFWGKLEFIANSCLCVIRYKLCLHRFPTQYAWSFQVAIQLFILVLFVFLSSNPSCRKAVQIAVIRSACKHLATCTEARLSAGTSFAICLYCYGLQHAGGVLLLVCSNLLHYM